VAEFEPVNISILELDLIRPIGPIGPISPIRPIRPIGPILCATDSPRHPRALARARARATQTQKTPHLLRDAG
jgi:hypothetical protein